MPQRLCRSSKVLIGLEIHVQLATRSKMFTAAENRFGAEPNTLVDEQALGLPGVLPVMNKRAVECAIMVGLALGCDIARHTKWDRKSYYYPDLPKNYQISQYDLPLCSNGRFTIADDTGRTVIRIRRAHLEEDAGKLLHEAPGGHPIPHSIVDLNRAGTPLLEIVTEPDLHTGRQVALFGQELQRLVQYLGVSHGQMQMGHMRFEPNINVHITDQDGIVHKTAITEIKNLNSFNALERATDYEIRRQINEWVETGSLGRKSTYGWDEARQITVHQRDKEEAHDYRYFPDPDLVPVVVDEAWLTDLKARVGELPQARRQRYVTTCGLSESDAATVVADRPTADLFEQVIELGADPKRLINLLQSHGRRLANQRGTTLAGLGLAAQHWAATLKLIEQNQLAPAEPAGRLLEHLIDNTEQDAAAAAATLGLLQSSDTSEIDSAIEAVIARNPPPLQDYRNGRPQALGALVGMVMRQTKGLNPRLVQQRIRQKLSASASE